MKKRLNKKKLEQNRILLLNMINKVDAISNYCEDEMVIIKLAKFQQQLYKLTANKEYYISEIDYKINDVIDDILKYVMKYKNNYTMDKTLNASLTNLIELLETRITINDLSL